MLSNTLKKICQQNPLVIDPQTLTKLTPYINYEIKKMSLLHHAVKYDNLSAVKFLVKHGAIVNSNVSGSTPLHLARSKEVAEFLIENRADKESKDKFGFTPLITAYYSNNFDVIDYLLTQKTDSKSLRAYLQADSKCTNDDLVTMARDKHSKLLFQNYNSDI